MTAPIDRLSAAITPRNGHATYDAAANGRLLLRRSHDALTPPVVTVGWFEPVRARVAR